MTESFERISNRSIEAEPLNLGGTTIILQRHEEYDRDRDSADAGHLTPKGRENGAMEAEERIRALIESTPVQERANLFFLVLASDTTFVDKGARSIETAEIVSEKINQLSAEYNIDEQNFLNISREYRGTEKGHPRPVAKLREPQIFEQTPDFVTFLKEKYPDFKDFWPAYEADIEKETRERMGAEGPEEMADRIEVFLKVIKKYSSLFHREKPDSRLIVWCVSHYDTISPWTKKYLLQQSATGPYLPVDYGAGVSVSLDSEGNANASAEGRKFQLDL